MICQHCGTDIAGKAIVCYRCGAPTSQPAPRRPAPARGRRAALAVAIVVAIVTTGAILVPWVPAGVPRVLAYAALALVTLASIRLFGGRTHR